MRSGDEPINHLVMDLMVVDFDVLHAFMKGRVIGDEDSYIVVTMHRYWGRRTSVELFEV